MTITDHYIFRQGEVAQVYSRRTDDYILSLSNVVRPNPIVVYEYRVAEVSIIAELNTFYGAAVARRRGSREVGTMARYTQAVRRVADQFHQDPRPFMSK